jgi:hypothetical protein
VGDCKRASRETRALIAAAGDFSRCPVAQGHLAPGEWAAAREAVWRGEPALVPVLRAPPEGEPQLSAAGCEGQGPLSLEVAGQERRGWEWRWVVRSRRQAPAAAAALRARVATAQAQGAA